MYRRSCGRTAERIDASRRPRIDFLVVKLTSGLRTTTGGSPKQGLDRGGACGGGGVVEGGSDIWRSTHRHIFLSRFF